jgi:small subunit ribosomal protein S6
VSAPPMAPTYDLMMLLDTTAEADRRDKIVADVEAAIEARGGIVGRYDWGPRPLAYEIRHKTDADYHLMQFTGPPELLEQLERSLRITDGVVRFRIIKVRPGTPPPPDGRASAVPSAAPGPAPVEASAG